MMPQLHDGPTLSCPFLARELEFHATGTCEDCDAREVAVLTMGEMDSRQHIFTPEMYQAYRYTLAKHNPSTLRKALSSPPALPDDPDVRRIIGKIERFIGTPEGFWQESSGLNDASRNALAFPDIYGVEA
jgi:hypothetical protein